MYIVSNHDACGCLPCDTPCNNCQGPRCVCLYKRPHAVAPVCSTRKCAEIDSLKVPYWFCVLKFSCLNICLCDYRTYSSCILGIYGQRIGSIAPVCRIYRCCKPAQYHWCSSDTESSGRGWMRHFTTFHKLFAVFHGYSIFNLYFWNTFLSLLLQRQSSFLT